MPHRNGAPAILCRAVQVFVLSSGSVGNAVVVESACGERLFVDAGVNPTQAAARMRGLGAELITPRRESHAIGIVVTHHHNDHIAHAQPLARALKAPLYFHDGISASRLRAKLDVRRYQAGTPMELGPFKVDAVHVPHDAPQVALRIESHGYAFGIATDIGHLTDALAHLLATCDEVLVESNHCPRMLDEGPYPPHLKRRIRGPYGHLANEETAKLVGRLAGSRVQRVWLGHVSHHNNTTERALDVVRREAGELPVHAIDHGASQHVAVKRSREQLAFAF